VKTAQDAMTFAAEWTRIAFTQFLSAEVKALVGIRDLGEWKFYAVKRFRGIPSLALHGAAIHRFWTGLWNDQNCVERARA
jgi:hypothetical protein